MLARTIALALALSSASARLTSLHGHGDAPAAKPAASLPCESPVRKAPVHFPDGTIVGGEGGFDMYSGYLNVTDVDYLFYWFFEAELEAGDDAPLIFWSNGGPGCSAMEGATTEHGPYVMYDAKENSEMFNGKLTKNPNAWNRLGHVVYVDQPRYVGFSCGTGDYVTTSVDAGLDMVVFINEFMVTFPEHAGRAVVIAAESYGGHYIPAWTGAILDHNSGGGGGPAINLQGIVIGNGLVNETQQDGAQFAAWAEAEGVVPPGSSPAGEAGARALMEAELGYTPNYYDYRVVSQSGCGAYGYNYKAWADWLLLPVTTAALNVCGDAGTQAFGGCAGGCISFPAPGFDSHDAFDYSGALERALALGIPLSFYYGKQDSACNYVGGYAMASALAWPGAGDFQAAGLQLLPLGVGEVQQGGGLTWVQVNGASHMVPIQQGAAGLFALSAALPPAAGKGKK